ncbi:GAF domain-containing protein [Kitasatospora cineracea]|uniref:GAF domain-containing protein n=1 Tax=Kitasatospora cineracea TaxID=88074 RepID=A0A3N4RFA4_9ACTN|nr:GAF domain-containing protein [Kitasatospora cineracea]ROR38384.1 GAF domain-containing protein [Kitasatospora cineracea]RPE32108.1 GAF domain-containing protein [Kitasatospora cineracea]
MQRTDGGGTPARASLRAVPPQSCEPPQHPQRPEIGDSWARLRRLGLDPERGRPARHLRPAELEETRRATGLEQVLPVLRSALFGPGEPAPVVLAVADPKARVLWLETDRRLRRDADAIGFEPGALWSEDEVGTNGIGLAARTARPSTVHSAEHYLRSHRGWTCVGVPVRDPRTGRLAGVIDLSGPATGDHPYLRQLALTAARLAETELRAGHLEALHRLRTVAVPLLARFGGPALVVDGAGWTAAATGVPGPPRLAPPPGDWGSGGVHWVPTLGECAVEPLADGWLVRPAAPRPAALAEQAGAAAVELDLRRPADPELRVRGSAGAWSHSPSPRHAELLLLLALHRDGLSAARLAEALFADPARTVTVRAELSRLRRHLGALLEARPYRLAARAEVAVLGPDDPYDLLPGSAAPAVREVRAALAGGALRLPGRSGGAQPPASSSANSSSLGSSSGAPPSGTTV